MWCRVKWCSEWGVQKWDSYKLVQKLRSVTRQVKINNTHYIPTSNLATPNSKTYPHPTSKSHDPSTPTSKSSTHHQQHHSNSSTYLSAPCPHPPATQLPIYTHQQLILYSPTNSVLQFKTFIFRRWLCLDKTVHRTRSWWCRRNHTHTEHISTDIRQLWTQ